MAFYHLSEDDVDNMTLDNFYGLLGKIPEVKGKRNPQSRDERLKAMMDRQEKK